MSTQVQYRRGSAAQTASFTGALGEITVDTTNKVVVVHDGATAGGFVGVGTTATQTLTNKTLSGATLSGTLTANSGVGSSGQYLESTGSGVRWSTIDATSIQNGTSAMTVIASGGNIRANVAGSTITTFTSTEANVGANLKVVGTSGFNTAAADAIVTVGGNKSAASWTTTGIAISNPASTYTDSSTAATGTATSNHINVLGLPTIASSNVATTTNASTLYIAGAPIAGTNQTITNKYALYIASGDSGFGGDILNLQGNGTGNIGSSSTYFNTAFVKATSAQYADVAERYLADAEYPVGTVLVIGGDKEVTQSTIDHQTSIAGTVSENPGVLMNRGLEGEFVAPVALIGRVPCRVIGPITKGDLLTSSHIPGVAAKMCSYAPGCVLGKALESYASDQEGVIEVMVGRL